MPEDRADIDGGALGRPETEPQRLHIDIEQRTDATQQVDRVGDGQHEEKGTAWICGNEDIRGVQLIPGKDLPAEEEYAEYGPGCPPAVELGATVGFERAAGHFQGNAH